MTGLEALQSVQYVEAKGKRFAVVPAEDWKVMIEWLENLEDLQVARHSLADLRKAGGDRQQARWLLWDDVREEL